MTLILAGGALALAACADATPEQKHEAGCIAGTLTGAVVGGLAGSLIGGGSGRQLATAAGAGPAPSPATGWPANRRGSRRAPAELRRRVSEGPGRRIAVERGGGTD